MWRTINHAREGMGAEVLLRDAKRVFVGPGRGGRLLPRLTGVVYKVDGKKRLEGKDRKGKIEVRNR